MTCGVCIGRVSALRRLSSRVVQNDPFNAFISKEVRTGEGNGKGNASLEGLTYAAKDNFSVSTTTCGSRILSNYVAPYSATVVGLLDEAGALLVGKANLDEFGMGSSNTNSYYGATLNPRYEHAAVPHVAGGSSGGSAAAVAAGLVDFSLGTDTGGSVRLPASYCGVVGFKPSYGRISRWGVIPYAQTLDTVGILARDVESVEKVYQVLDHVDDKDPTTLTQELRTQFDQQGKDNNRKLTIGIPSEFLVEELSTNNRGAWLEALETFREKGHIIKEVSIPSIKKSLSAYYTIATAEAASNLARYDGLRYGLSEEAKTVKEEEENSGLISKNRTLGFGPEVQKRILLGNYTLSSDSGNHYMKATQVRESLVKEFNQVFKFPNFLLQEPGSISGCDVLLSPTAVGDTPSIEEYELRNKENPLHSYVNDLLTVPASLAGLPAISIPWNHSSPHGIQLMTQFGDEATLFEAANLLQSQTTS
ncbi:glutamyl-tRNA(Gln) amidotransferase subunit A, mitochondrial [[Candida] anglica]|uniref:Glutamyl-tRNA(Gln) amidotransferase subunit A, mitochondrial n=1 Tax=[Candida] anglica TaxID=148631 RepID=A0ABP0ELG8_9ASCO